MSVLLLQYSQSAALPLLRQPPPPPPPPPPNHRYMHLVTILLLCTIVVMASVFVYLMNYYFVGPRMPRTTSAGAVGLLTGGSLDAEVINSFPTFVYSEVKALKIGMGGLQCAVCLNEFEDDETIRLLPHCSHAFHSGCIDKWLSSHVTCPVCRTDVTDLLYRTRSPSGSGGVSCDESVRETRHESSSPYSDAVADEFISIPIETPITRFTAKMGTLDQIVLPSGSGGEPVAEPGEEWDRFTLRLPEEVQSRLMRSRLNRTRSCVGFGRARSLKNEDRSGS